MCLCGLAEESQTCTDTSVRIRRSTSVCRVSTDPAWVSLSRLGCPVVTHHSQGNRVRRSKRVEVVVEVPDVPRQDPSKTQGEVDVREAPWAHTRPPPRTSRTPPEIELRMGDRVHHSSTRAPFVSTGTTEVVGLSDTWGRVKCSGKGCMRNKELQTSRTTPRGPRATRGLSGSETPSLVRRVPVSRELHGPKEPFAFRPP